MNPQATAHDEYVRTIVSQHTPVITYEIAEKIKDLTPHVHLWANGYEYELQLSGSHAKGTAITGTTDVDIFISLHSSVGEYNTLENVYTTLRNRLTGAGYLPREQNVSLGINHSQLKIDLVPGVRQGMTGTDHSLWKRKAKTWTKTNIDTHIHHVSSSQRTQDMRAIKIWRKLQGLDFPSFYLELSVLEALSGYPLDNPAGNFVRVMEYLSTDFLDKVIKDPSNTNNPVSEELTIAEKQKIKSAAIEALRSNWNQVLW